LIQRVKRVLETLPKGFAEALPEPFRKGMPNQEQEQEQEQEEIHTSESESDSSPIASQKTSLASNGKLTPLASAWNELCPKLPAVREVSAARKRKEQVRLKEHDLGWWRGVFERINSTPFLRGESKGGWRASFDWVVKNSENGSKVLEGVYSSTNGNGSHGKAHSAEDITQLSLGAE
jgi:hypothetical protein